MTNPIELKRKELELIRLGAAKAEIEFNIEERLADIERMKAHILLNEEKQEKVKQEIKEMTNG